MPEVSERTATGPEQSGAVIMQLPPHIARFCEQVATLPPGRYIMTLTITEEQKAFWTKQRMGQVER
jgi:hypothetical protein